RVRRVRLPARPGERGRGHDPAVAGPGAGGEAGGERPPDAGAAADRLGPRDPEPDGMKISILLTHVPFVWGGAEYLAETLRGRLRARGHQAELVRVPFKWYPPSAVLDHMLACRHLRLASGDPDLVIPMKIPVYLGSFPNARVWLLH